jgi:plasmid maintenance system antidote protein VapI
LKIVTLDGKGEWRYYFKEWSGKRSVTADAPLRLARYSVTSEKFWLNLQARFDIEVDQQGQRGKA